MQNRNRFLKRITGILSAITIIVCAACGTAFPDEENAGADRAAIILIRMQDMIRSTARIYTKMHCLRRSSKTPVCMNRL